jgi:hypothetical protein
VKGAHKGRGLRVTLVLLAIGLLATAISASGGSAHAGVSASACLAGTTARQGHFGGVVSAARVGCQSPADGRDSPVSSGSPPLLFHNGQVMGTSPTDGVTVTPIFWHPAGHPMAADYESLITQYLGDVAADSGKDTNVFSTLTEYFGTNGNINYKIKLGTPIDDTNPLPADGCILDHKDLTGIYPDGSGYDSCIDDAQVNAETASVVQANKLTVNLSHIYVLFIPKHVETCFNPGSTTSRGHGVFSQACTINHSKVPGGYCAYHTMDSNRMVYANLSYPIYHSPLQTALFTCGSDAGIAFGRNHLQSPNGTTLTRVDADVEVSPTSHEIMEAITDPDVSTGWYDAVGNENGDECAYRFDTPVGGTAADGNVYNQVINGHHYLTQTEFSNKDFANTGLGCLQSEPTFP